MPIRYYLQKNAIAANPEHLKARVLPTDSLDHKAIVKAMLKTGSTITEADIEAVMTTFYAVVARKVAEGNNVNLPIANFRTSITGIFKGSTDQLDPGRHTPKAKVLPGKLLREMVAGADLEKTRRGPPEPQLVDYRDVTSGQINSIVSPNGIGVLAGAFLNFNPINDAEGLYFRHSDGMEFKVILFSELMNKKLVFQVPQLTAGNYELELRKEFGKTQSLLRKNQLHYALVVM